MHLKNDQTFVVLNNYNKCILITAGVFYYIFSMITEIWLAMTMFSPGS